MFLFDWHPVDIADTVLIVLVQKISAIMYCTKIKNTKIDLQVVFDPCLARSPVQMSLIWAVCLRKGRSNGGARV